MRFVAVLALLLPLQEKKKDPATTKEAMQKIQLLVGEWRCTGEPDDKKAKPWLEKDAWNFKIDKEDYALELKITDGAHFKEGLLTYDLKAKVYRLVATPLEGDKKTYEGKLADKELALERVPKDGEKDAKPERLVFNLLRDNRFLLSLETRQGSSKEWSSVFVMGCTKEGVPFVKGSGAPVCIITGGTAALTSDYKGKTYHFC